MKSPKEPEQYILYNDLTDSSAWSPLESPGDLAILQKLLYETTDTSWSLSELSSDKVMSELPSGQGSVPGGGFEQGSLCHREEDCDTAFRFQSLPVQSCFPDFQQLQPNLFQVPLEPMPRTGTGATVYRACFKQALDGMSGELYNAVDSIASEGSEDYSENVSYKQEMSAEHTQSRMDMYQQVLCDINGAGQVVPLNSCRMGQTIHTIPINHMLSIPEHHFHTPAQRDTTEHSTTLSEVTPIQMVKISSVPGTCPVASPPYMLSSNLPLVQPASTFLTLTFLVPPASLGAGLSYNSLPGPYYSQMPGPEAIGVVTDDPSKMSLIRFSGTYWDSKSKKPCNCTKSQCLKLYCECFANGDVCSSCNCINCCNNTAHESERDKAIRICLDRNPEAFHRKIGNRKLGEIKGCHNKGCNCKRSGCLKNYCECYEAKIMCSSTCKCVGCRNYEESPERRTSVSAGCEGDRNASVYMRAIIETRKCPLACITPGVVEATCGSLIALAEEAEREGRTSSQAEKMILEEFGQCLRQIVQSIFKSDGLLA